MSENNLSIGATVFQNETMWQLILSFDFYGRVRTF